MQLIYLPLYCDLTYIVYKVPCPVPQLPRHAGRPKRWEKDERGVQGSPHDPMPMSRVQCGSTGRMPERALHLSSV